MRGTVCAAVKYLVILVVWSLLVAEPRCQVAACQGRDKDGGGETAVAHGGHLHRNWCVPLKADYHRTETLPGRCHLLQRLQKGFLSKAEPITSTGKRWQIEPSRCIDTRDFFPLASVSLFKLGFQFPTAEREDIKLENKTEVALVEKERKPLIFPPISPSIWWRRGWLRMLRQLMMWFVTMDHRWAGENCSHSQHVAERLPVPSAFSHEINSGGSTGNPHQRRDGF